MIPFFVTAFALGFCHMYFSRAVLARKEQGRHGPPPLMGDVSGLRCGASCDLVKGGADHLKHPDMRSSLEHLAQ
jgi:hypothetical protein